MTPLRVEALLAGAICLPNGPIALDALLMAAVALRDGLPPPANAEECVDLPIPIAQDRGVYLASFGSFEVDAREHAYTNRRFPLSEAQDLAGPRLRRIDVGAGPTKSYRIPREHLHLVNDLVTWWAIGDRDSALDLLAGWVHYLGKRRAVGLGKVREWTAVECDAWPGFPVLLAGQPTRSLPLDWPGLSTDAERAYAPLRPPYWAHHRRVECAVP